MRNQKGFMFPTTLVIALFCLLIVAYVSNSLISEKQFYKETEQYYLLENLMKLAVDQSLHEIKNGTAKLNEMIRKNTFNGSIEYKIEIDSSGIYEVKLLCKTTINREYTATYQYDMIENEMIQWSEY